MMWIYIKYRFFIHGVTYSTNYIGTVPTKQIIISNRIECRWRLTKPNTLETNPVFFIISVFIDVRTFCRRFPARKFIYFTVVRIG